MKRFNALLVVMCCLLVAVTLAACGNNDSIAYIKSTTVSGVKFEVQANGIYFDGIYSFGGVKRGSIFKIAFNVTNTKGDAHNFNVSDFNAMTNNVSRESEINITRLNGEEKRLLVITIRVAKEYRSGSKILFSLKYNNKLIYRNYYNI